MLRRVVRQLVAKLLSPALAGLASRQHDALALLGRSHAMRVRELPDGADLSLAEFKAFSQWGEDGILQYLVAKTPVPTPWFVEFGVETYQEANTRFLLVNDNWSGLVMDGSAENIAAIRRDAVSWKHELAAEQCFVTRENVDAAIARHAPGEDVGILSIDIDGNDYWVWQAIRCIHPRIVVMEYNSLFGPEADLSIPYQADFYRLTAHYSALYWGASLAALCRLGEEKGYDFVGSNTAGNNAFFVRKDVSGRLRKRSAREAYVRAKFRESRSSAGELTYLTAADGLRLIADLPVMDFRRGSTVALREALQ